MMKSETTETVTVSSAPRRPESGAHPSRLSRLVRHRYLDHYNRLFVLVLVVNVWLLWHGTKADGWWHAGQNDVLSVLSDLVLGNFAVAILVRQQYVINFLFRIATAAPVSWPLWIRWTLGKVYHFGGLHSGSAFAGTVWYLAFMAELIRQPLHQLPVGVRDVTITLMLLLVCMLITALPPLRKKFHDCFERVHRFGGWSVLTLFWIQSYLLAEHVTAWLDSVSFWLLCLLTFSVVLPWLRLKKVRVETHSPSSHVTLARFNYGVTPIAGSSTSISRHPLLEWHAFANVPSPGEPGFRLTISRAGDWTGKFIDDMPDTVWVKGIPTAGVANIEVLFRKVVYVATGSGIGPCLPHLLAKKVPAQLIWSTRSPRQTYGDALVDEILTAVPDAFIWDTRTQGKPDLVSLAYDMCRSSHAEAVICISNESLTRKVVYGLEIRGIPAYGAIWDS